MCGIAGFWRISGTGETARVLRAMADPIAHRGLSILDLSPAGHQPMFAASVRHVIAFNGEIYLGNLVDAIQLCLAHPAAAGRTFLLSDGEDVSTPELIRRLARVMGRPVRLLAIPPAWFELGGRVLGREAEVRRLLGSLCIDGNAIREELGWVPPYTLDQGLAETVRAWGERE